MKINYTVQNFEIYRVSLKCLIGGSCFGRCDITCLCKTPVSTNERTRINKANNILVLFWNIYRVGLFSESVSGAPWVSGPHFENCWFRYKVRHQRVSIQYSRVSWIISPLVLLLCQIILNKLGKGWWSSRSHFTHRCSKVTALLCLNSMGMKSSRGRINAASAILMIIKTCSLTEMVIFML